MLLNDVMCLHMYRYIEFVRVLHPFIKVHVQIIIIMGHHIIMSLFSQNQGKNYYAVTDRLYGDIFIISKKHTHTYTYLSISQKYVCSHPA